MIVKKILTNMKSVLLVWMILLSPIPVIAGPVESSEQKVIRVVPLTHAGVTKSLYNQIDRLVPQLKKISANEIVKLECHYNGNSKQEQDVVNAFMIAARIEKYLREHHKLKIDMWLSAHLVAFTHENPTALIFSVLSKDINYFENQAPIPVKVQAE